METTLGYRSSETPRYYTVASAADRGRAVAWVAERSARLRAVSSR